MGSSVKIDGRHVRSNENRWTVRENKFGRRVRINDKETGLAPNAVLHLFARARGTVAPHEAVLHQANLSQYHENE